MDGNPDVYIIYDGQHSQRNYVLMDIIYSADHKSLIMWNVFIGKHSFVAWNIHRHQHASFYMVARPFTKLMFSRRRQCGIKNTVTLWNCVAICLIHVYICLSVYYVHPSYYYTDKLAHINLLYVFVVALSIFPMFALRYFTCVLVIRIHIIY